MTKHTRRPLYAMLFAAFAIMTVGVVEAQAQTQVRIGPEVAWGSDTDLGVGGRLTADIPVTEDEGSFFNELRGIGQFLFWVDCDGCTMWEINANGVVPVSLGGDSDFYAGAGLNVFRFSADVGDVGGVDLDASTTELGLNILGGLNFELGNLAAFGEAGFRISDFDQFVIGAGILFGG